MARGNDLVIAVTADATAVAAGLRPATSALGAVEKEALDASKALSNLDKQKVDPDVKISLNQQAISKARADIARLRDQMAHDVLIGADTKAAEKEIARLQRSIRQLEKSEVRVNVETTGDGKLESLKDTFLSLRGGGPAAAIGAMALSLVKLSADAESAALQMRSVVRDGGNVVKILEDLRRFGAQSPFEFPELQESARKLVSFGVASKDVVQTVKNLGEVAAATGTPISDLSSIYGQMIAKGKVQSEELLQLAERGVPVYEALGNVLGVSADEARRLAEEGKVGREEVSKLDDELAKMFAGSTAAQAETLNGKVSTLTDSFKDLSRTLGDSLAPNAKAAVGGLDQLLQELSKVAGWFESNENTWWMSILVPKPFEQLDAVNNPGEGIKGTAQAFAEAMERMKAAGDTVNRVTPDWEQFARTTEDVNDELNGMVKGLDLINKHFITGREAQSDYQEAIDELAESIEEHGKTLDLSTEAGRENDANVRQQAQTLAALTEARLKDAKASGGSTDAILADYADQRDSLYQTLRALGLGEEEARAYVDQLLRTPDDLKTYVELTNLDAERAKLEEFVKPRTIPTLITLEVANLTEYQKRKIRQDVESSLADNAVTRSGVAGQSVVGSPTVNVAPRIYLDSEPIRAVARTSGAQAGAQAAVAAQTRGRL